MTEMTVSIVGTLISLAAVLVSYVSYRHALKRERELDERERRLRQQEALALHESAVKEHVSLIVIRLDTEQSLLREGWYRRILEVANRSDRAIRDLRGFHGGRELRWVSGRVDGGYRRRFHSPSGDPSSSILQGPVTVEFTDAFGCKWRHDGDKLLLSAPAESGVLEWHEQEMAIGVWQSADLQLQEYIDLGNVPQYRRGVSDDALSERAATASCVLVVAGVLGSFFLFMLLMQWWGR